MSMSMNVCIVCRATGGSNPHRSLPDIPIYTDGVDVACSDNGVSGDTSSDLYATVEDKVSGSNRRSLPNGVHSQSQSPRRPRENPYDKVKRTENPYAAVETTVSDGIEEVSHSRDSLPRYILTFLVNMIVS